METVYSGLYQKPLVVQKITTLIYVIQLLILSQIITPCLSQFMKQYYQLTLKIT